MAPLYDLERQSVDCPFPLIPLHLRQAKRKRIEEYVDRLVDLLLLKYTSTRQVRKAEPLTCVMLSYLIFQRVRISTSRPLILATGDKGINTRQ